MFPLLRVLYVNIDFAPLEAEVLVYYIREELLTRSFIFLWAGSIEYTINKFIPIYFLIFNFYKTFIAELHK